jgi:hypothetical protein
MLGEICFDELKSDNLELTKAIGLWVNIPNKNNPGNLVYDAALDFTRISERIIWLELNE